MTVLYVKGTNLADKGVSKPLVKPFLISLGILFLLAMHYFQHNPGGSGLELSFNAMSWIPFSFAIAFGLLEICRQRIWRYTRLTVVLFICCVLLTLPIFYPNAAVAVTLHRLIGLWAGLLFFIALQQFSFHQKQRQRILWLILGAVWIEALFGWVQFLLLEPGNVIGYNTIVDRPYGIFQQPNVMGSFLATGLLLSAYLLARIPMYRGKWSRQQLVLIATPIITIPLLVLLTSRTGWLAAVVGTLLILPYLFRFAAKAQWRMWLLMVALGLSISWGITSSSEKVKDHLNLVSARAMLIPQSVDMFLNKPLTGYGYGTFEASYITQTALWHHDNPTQPAGLATLDHPHNELAYWAAEGGVVPLTALLIAAAAVFFKVKKARAGTQLALVGLFFPLTLHTQLEYPFYHSLVHWIVFIILIYWVDNLTAKYYRLTMNYTLSIKILTLALPLLITGYMATTLYSGYLLTKYETTKPVNIDYLLKVNNPWAWQNRFEWDLYVTHLQLGVSENNPQLIQEYINWAQHKAKLWPRPPLYQNLIAAYQYLGQDDMAEQIRQEALYLFPNGEFDLQTKASASQAAPISNSKPSLP